MHKKNLLKNLRKKRMKKKNRARKFLGFNTPKRSRPPEYYLKRITMFIPQYGIYMTYSMGACCPFPKPNSFPSFAP